MHLWIITRFMMCVQSFMKKFLFFQLFDVSLQSNEFLYTRLGYSF